jgi:small-conductance mechanosensitive channel
MLLTEKYQAMRRTRLRLSDEVDSQTQRLQQLAELRKAWDERYRLATEHRESVDTDTYSQLKTQQKDAKAVLSELASNSRTQIAWIGEVRETLGRVTKKAEGAAKGPAEVLTWIQEQQRQLEGMQRIYERNLVTIEDSRRVHEKLLDEVSASLKVNTPSSLAMDALYQVKTAWNTSFMHINNEPITVGMAIQGLTTLVLGWVLSRFVSAMVAYRILKRFKLSKDATTAIRSLVFYSMLFGVVAEALHMVNVDLTAFTILGGGLAIGVGFGSQALINNFIGGLIMLAERPVRLGERITFGNFDGVVEDVGFRCTKLRTNTDHLVTIPNSTLVNESIENIDRRRTIRRNMSIAVTYNITREKLAEAVQAIRDILEERDIRERIHPIVGFEEFLPRVFFSEFAAESLTIQVVYWYAPVDWWAYMEHSERVNFRIMEEFERMGIDFAFPSKTSFVKNAKKTTGREPGSYAA